MPKFHKPTAKQRFIASLGNCTTTTLSKVLSSVLNLVLSVLRRKDDVNIIDTGIRRFFVINGYEEVANFLPNIRGFSSTTRPLYTGDFSTMYTTIPHRDLITRLYRCVDEAVAFVASEYSRTTHASNILFAVTKDFTCTTIKKTRTQTNSSFDSD